MTTPPCIDDSAPRGNAAGRRQLDAKALAELAALDPDGTGRLLPRVLATYEASLLRLVEQAQAALRASDPAALRLAVHTLKSSSASVGALALSELCASAEQAVRLGRQDDLPLLVERLVAESERVRQAVRDLLSDCA